MIAIEHCCWTVKKMNKILYDLYEAQPFGTSKFHGGGEYIKAIFKHLVLNYSKDVQLIVYYDFASFLDTWILDLISEYHIKAYDIKDRSQVKSIIDSENIDIWYSGIPYHYKKDDVGNRAVLKGTIHGLRSIEMPADKYAYIYMNGKKSFKEIIRYIVRNQYKNAEWKKFGKCIAMLDEIICDSQHSKYSLIQKYPDLHNKKVDVFYAPQKICEMSNINNEASYILILGGDRWVKNAFRAMMALDNLYDSKLIEPYEIYVVGSINPKIKSKIKNIHRFHELGYVETEKLEELYNNCKLLLYPSLNEGFGLPPLEAMKYGKTCIVSGVCSLPEVCGNAAYYVNPVDIDEISSRVLCALENPIKKDIVLAQYEKILKRENEDVDKLCKFIIYK